MPSINAIPRKIKVLIVDDSAIVRQILSEAVAAEPDMEVVGTAPDPYVAHDKILALHPDVLTLDIEMPRMDGLTFLKQLMHHHPIPTIIISSLGQASCAATLEALRCGAVDVLAKPAGPYSVGELRQSLAARIRGAAGARPRIARDLAANVRQQQKPVAASNFTCDPRTVIAIGASTGGTVAIQEILLQLSADMPPMVITQHIPAGFSLAFANRLNKLCSMEVREAVDGDMLHAVWCWSRRETIICCCAGQGQATRSNCSRAAGLLSEAVGRRDVRLGGAGGRQPRRRRAAYRHGNRRRQGHACPQTRRRGDHRSGRVKLRRLRNAARGHTAGCSRHRGCAGRYRRSAGPRRQAARNYSDRQCERKDHGSIRREERT